MRRALALILIMSLVLTLCACNAVEEPDGDDFWAEDRPAQEKPQEEESAGQIDELCLPRLTGQTLDPVTCIDGVQQTLGALLYEGLFALDGSLAPQSVLCAESVYDAATRTYTLTLRAGVRFSDGSPLTADDVLATYRRAAESTRYGARFAKVESMRAADERTLVITLGEENAFFCALLDIPVVKAGTEGDLVPLGTGPYVLTEEADGAALLVNSEWRGGQPPLARIGLVSAKDNDTAQSLFASRSVHLLRLDPTGTDTQSIGGAIALQSVPTTVMQFLGFRMSSSLLSDAAVRRAMSGVLERTELVSALLSGHGAAAQLPVSPESERYPRTLEYHTTEEEYAAALEKAGVTAARPRRMTLLVNAENSFKRAVAESVAAQLSTTVLTVEVSALAWEEYLAALAAGSFDLYLGEVRMTADWDAGALLDASGALNYGGFASETLSAQLESFLAGGSMAYFKSFVSETPFAPLLFKSDAVLTPAGLIDGMTPTVSDPFYGLQRWVFHLSDAEE